MACAEGIWKRHIQPAGTDKDSTSLMKYVTQIRPLEKHKIQTDPTFRQLHEMILHIGIALRLDAWRVEVCRRYPGISSLEEWAKTSPKWEDICEISNGLWETFIVPANMSRGFQEEDEQRDQAFEITKAYHKDFLLYEETNYAMNQGDIGRLDACLTQWIFYFMGCGKAKYAHAIHHYLENMYIVYPKPLAKAIRINSLVNPTGHKGHFRGIDWVIEHNNLYIKRIFGGSGSNHTVERMVQASPLIEIYKDIREQFEKMFCLVHKTSRHSPPKMKLTFEKLQKYMEKNQANCFIPGRVTEHQLINTIPAGMVKLTKAVEDARQAWKAKREKQEQLAAEAGSRQNTSRSIASNVDVDKILDEEDQTVIPNEEDPIETETLDDDDGNLFVDDD
ncbi:hypothetical protein AGABI1DRAFT_103440 [Agaricus bisporus var. burnettii JB137-S8]|nr:uncharacterized protein AGABI1DRAFT_103440 [Agaricus bisporus var. burnettii JB137-S8]EKM74281.1 hypothetical protein AGABI1DRAFT_103440 [Agaricus bisporus var. burnettii JB137-S8]